MKFRAYIVEDSPTIRENLIETLHELALVDAVGTAETENEGKQWLAQNDDYWDLAIVDLFLKEGSGLNILEACRYAAPGPEDGGSEQPRHQRRALALRRSWGPMRYSTSPPRSTRWSTTASSERVKVEPGGH